MTKGVEDGMGEIDPNVCIHGVYLRSVCAECDPTPALKDEVEYCKPRDCPPQWRCEHVWSDCAPVGNQGVTREYCNKCTITRPLVKQEPSPTLKDEVGHDDYQRGFNDCREKAMRIVDEHDGFLSRIEGLKP